MFVSTFSLRSFQSPTPFSKYLVFIDMRHYYGFVGMPNQWVDELNGVVSPNFFDDKEYVDYYFDNFFDMDKMFGHENSLVFGTRGLPVGHPQRTSRSFDRYNDRFGPAIVRVLKNSELNENIYRIKELMVK